MAGVRRPQRRDHEATRKALASITQAQYMVGIYAEIVTMDQTIIERVRQLVAKQSIEDDRDAYLANLRLVLAQLEKVGERISFWNQRVHTLVEGELQA